MNELSKPPAPSVGALLGSLASETGTLVRQEIRLATTEMGHKAKRATGVLGTVVIGGALVYAGVLAILFGVVVAVSAFIPWWISAVVLGAVVAVVGFGIMRVGLTALHGIDAAPRKTLETLRDDGVFLKEQFR